jgi:hypothetical protein
MRDLNDIMKDFSDKLTDKSEPNGVQKILNARKVLTNEWNNASTDGDKKALLEGYARLLEFAEKAVKEYADSYDTHQGTGNVTGNKNGTIKLRISDDEAFKKLVVISCNMAVNCSETALELKDSSAQATALQASGTILRSVAKYADLNRKDMLTIIDKNGLAKKIDTISLESLNSIAMGQLRATTHDGQQAYILAEASKAIKEATKVDRIDLTMRPSIIFFAENT